MPDAPLLVQFGAGNIGRGFIAPLFSAGGWRVLFVDVDVARIHALHQRGRYTVSEITDHDERQVAVAPVDGLLASESEAVAAALADAALVATAVGLGALPHLGANLAAGLRRRWQRNDRPLDVLVCENGVQAPAILQAAIAERLTPAERDRLADGLGCVRSSIGRMIPPPPAEADPLDIAVEPYACLPVERAAFRGPPPGGVPGLKAVDDFELVLRQKLYLHNMSHACCAYAGFARGYEDLPRCVADADLVAGVRRACAEVTEALARAHGDGDAGRMQAIRDECGQLVEDLLRRYGNRRLNDPIRRVARDPIRKLGPDDRLVGAARLCEQHGVRPLALARHILLAAEDYRPAADEPQAERFLDLQHQGWSMVLRDIAGLQTEEPLMTTLDIAARQKQAAGQIDAAGIYLRPDEIDQIEIADFGLKRYEQLGLAIHVYVNTDRCCAKELAMLPGQICPEHLHPPVDGEPGKEETFRVRQGEVHLFLPGDDSDEARGFAEKLLPEDKRDSVTIYRHVHLRTGDQYIIPPDTAHWFVAGKQGAVVSEFSTRSRDEADIFTDPEIQRVPDEGPHQG